MTALASFLVGMILVSAEPVVGLPFGVPPGPDEPMLARVLPEQCLLCVAWNGTAAPNAKSGNRTEQLLAEPEVQHFLRGLGHLVDQEARSQHKDEKDPAKKRLQDEGVAGVETLATCPGVLWIEKAECRKVPAAKPGEKGPVASVLGHRVDIQKAAAVFFLGKNTEQRAAVEKMLVAANNLNGDIKRADSKAPLWLVPSFSEPYHCQLEGDCLFVTGGQGVLEAIQERMKANQPPPAWWTAIAQQLPVERRSVALRVDLRAMRELGLAILDSKQQAEARTFLDVLGLSNATSYVEAWGLDGDDFANKSLLVLDGEPQGMLRLLVSGSVKTEQLSAIPPDASLAAAFHLDLQETLDLFLAAAKKLDPKKELLPIQGIEELERAMGIDLHGKAMRSLGDTWCVYASPSEGNFVFTGLTAVVPLRDWAGMNVAYGRLTNLARQWKPANGTEQASPQTPPRQLIKEFSFQDQTIYYLADSAGIMPAWCMTKTEMVVALSPLNIKSYLARRSHSPASASRLPKADGASLIAWGEARSGLQSLYSIISLGLESGMHAFQQQGFEAGMSMFPSLYTLDRHMGPTQLTLRRSSSGVEVVSRGTIPLPSGPAWMGLVAASRYSVSDNAFQSSITPSSGAVGQGAGKTSGDPVSPPVQSMAQPVPFGAPAQGNPVVLPGPAAHGPAGTSRASGYSSPAPSVQYPSTSAPLNPTMPRQQGTGGASDYGFSTLPGSTPAPPAVVPQRAPTPSPAKASSGRTKAEQLPATKN